MFQWEPNRPSQLLIYDKRDLSLLKTIEVPPAFVFHFGNGWERGGKIIFTASQYANAAFMKHGMSGLAQQRSGPYEDETRLLRYEIDLATNSAKIEYLDTNLEFPSFDRRYPFQQQAVLGVSNNRARVNSMQSAIVRVDPETSVQERFDYGADIIVEEPQFIPSAAATPGQGFILHSYLNYRTERSGLAILRSDALEQGPIMTAEMDRCLPLGFHGCFVPV
jgi:carotenoid cleavage dioxygenase-like enzyme